MVMTESVAETLFLVRLQAFSIKIKALLEMTITESVTEFVFTKASNLYFEWQ